MTSCNMQRLRLMPMKKWKEAEEYTNQFFEERAAELEVTVDYYIQEFVE